MNIFESSESLKNFVDYAVELFFKQKAEESDSDTVYDHVLIAYSVDYEKSLVCCHAFCGFLFDPSLNDINGFCDDVRGLVPDIDPDLIYVYHHRIFRDE